jgi:hypothetical protein
LAHILSARNTASFCSCHFLQLLLLLLANAALAMAEMAGAALRLDHIVGVDGCIVNRFINSRFGCGKSNPQQKASIDISIAFKLFQIHHPFGQGKK